MDRSRHKYLEIHVNDTVQGTWDGMRIGSESCSQLVPSVQVVQSLSREKDPACLSLVTPIAGPDEIVDVMNAVKAAVSEGWQEVVVNDWGVLSGLAELEIAGGIGFTAGRLLMRFRRGPGACELSDSPGVKTDLATRRYFAWGPLYDSPFLAFLRANGIDRIELDLPRDWVPVPEETGFRLSFCKDTRLVSITGQCPWLYNPEVADWSPSKGCGRPCREKSDIVMNAPALKRPLLLRGRAILERVEVDIEELQLPDSVDRIIYDRFEV